MSPRRRDGGRDTGRAGAGWPSPERPPWSQLRRWLAWLTVASALHLIGVPFGPAVLAAVLYRVFAFWLPIVPALAFLPLVSGLADDLERTPLQPADDPLARLAGEESRGAGEPDAAPR
jgi:hypothetical protein